MSESSRATPEKKQVEAISPQNKTPDQEKEQLKSEILNLKEKLSQNESFRERVIDAEAKISSLQQSNDDLSRQVQNLTFQNNQLLKELASLRNLRSPNSNKDAIGNQSYSNSNDNNNENDNNNNNNANDNNNDNIRKLKKAFTAMQQKFQEELAFKDDIIQNMRTNINFTNTSQNTPEEKIQNKKQKLTQQRYIIKQNLAKKKNDVMKELIIIDSDNTDSSSQSSNSQTDQKLLEQKYMKKKNELTLMKQQFDELKEESHHQIKKSKESVDEVRQKFHLLKKKYVELKEDFSSLQVCYQAVVQKAETLSAELQKANRNIDGHFIDDLPKITIKTHDYKLRKAEEKDRQQKDKYKEMKKRAQKAEKESEQLRYFIQVLANNEKNFDKLNINNQNIINQLEALGIRIDHLENKTDHRSNALPQRHKSNDYQEPYPAQRRKMNDYQEKNQINIYQEVHSHHRKKSNDNQNHHSSQRNKIDRQRHQSPQIYEMSDDQDSYSPQRNNKFEYRNYPSPNRRSKSVKKEVRKLPSWRKFKDL